MTRLKKLISYLYPIRVKQIPSSRSGQLEITMVNGKLLIDAEHVNYSYGNLQKALKKGLTAIGETKLNSFKNILVLGVAGGSVIETIRRDFKLHIPITGVEIDADVIGLANEYFNLDKAQNLDLKIDDAFDYISNTKDTFDLIIVDIFNDEQMPDNLFNKVFWVDIYKTLNSNGVCLFNSIVSSNREIERNQQLHKLNKGIFKSIQRIKTQKINELFILERD
ncbi:spermidine synthase [Pseudofulvibacter geojedonensis]|uniref:Spermidine synthase n=1 Tax=Pseudofulvibacter geojedonensis TaxID=1123758 RepID=A0ABW3HYN0_9FLAO